MDKEQILNRIIAEDQTKMLLSFGEKEMKHNGLEYLMVRKDLALAAMEEYASLQSPPSGDMVEAAGKYAMKNCRSCNEVGYYGTCECYLLEDAYLAGASHGKGDSDAVAKIIVQKIGEYAESLGNRTIGLPMMDEVAVMQMEDMVQKIIDNPSDDVEIPEYY